MPVRVKAKTPGEFIRDHLVNAGGVDYVQAIFTTYKNYLKDQGYEKSCSRATMSRYIWLCNKIGLIAFDHAGPVFYWDNIQNALTPPANYQREPRPQAPSPRHYYRIVDPDDPRWLNLEVSYREAMGFEVVAPAFKRPTIEVVRGIEPRPKEKKEVRVLKPEIQVGDVVRDDDGRYWEVLGIDDPSLLRVRSFAGGETRIGRGVVTRLSDEEAARARATVKKEASVKEKPAPPKAVEEKPVETVIKKAKTVTKKAKKPAKPEKTVVKPVEKVKPEAREIAKPFEDKIGAVLAMLDFLEREPTPANAQEVEDSLLTIAEQIQDVAARVRPAERAALGSVTSRIRKALEHVGLLRSSVQRLFLVQKTARAGQAREAFSNALRVVREDLTEKVEG